MNKIVGIVSGFTLTGAVLLCLKLVMRNLIRNNPEKVFSLILYAVGQLINLSINIFDWIFSILL